MRFWERVEGKDGNGCWEWTGQRTSNGYGRVEYQERGQRVRVRAHRLAWELTNGPIPDGMCVLHRCDNPRCVRVDHLFLGTQLDNIADMHAKGRHVPPPASPRGVLFPGARAAQNLRKTACPKCGGPLVPSPHKSQGGRRRCPPCTRAHQAKYMRERRANRCVGRPAP